MEIQFGHLPQVLMLTLARVTAIVSAVPFYGGQKVPKKIKMATALVTIGPIIFLYPFVQKYFIKGIIIGAVKG